MVLIIQSLVDGILIGGVYAAIGLGLSLAYGVMGVVNWMHGEMLMVSMFISFYLTKFAGFDPYMTAIVTILVAGSAGFLLQRYVLNTLVHRSKLAWRDILLFTAGAGMALQAAFNMGFGAEVKAVETKYSGMMRVGEILISKPKTISFVIAVVCCVGLYFYLQHSEAGRALRATAQDRSTAQLMGINADFVFGLAFALSLGLVGLSGALLIPFYSVNPYVGSAFSFKSFIIVAMGGKGNIPGALMAGIVISVIEKVGGYFVGDNLAQIFIFILFIVILIVRPDGLLVRTKKE
jgi:Branched-chain amino acid ABC-type transport system, permease components